MVSSIDPGACRHKLVLSTADRDEAMRTASALAELLEPPADAVAVFETPGTDTGAPPTGWRVDAYYLARPDAEAIAAAIANLVGVERPRLVLETVPDENWVALSQQALPPVVAGRFTVHGSHDRGRVPRGPWSILIDAGEAFGTAHHATTLGCLMAVDRLSASRRYRCVLDLGCGTGVLAIAARRTMPRARILMSDIDPVAVAVAKQNARANGITSIVAVVADGVPRLGHGSIDRHDLVIANILARPLVLLAPRIARSVASRGTLVLSGLLNSQSREVIGAYLPRGFSLARHDKIAGWSTLTLVRR
jgi:ribosomal protein L11 methyltransferase